MQSTTITAQDEKSLSIVSSKYEDMGNYKKSNNCDVYTIHAKVTDIKKRADSMMRILLDESWIHKLDIVPKRSYQARSEKTVEKLVNDILKKVTSTVNTEFGEFLISVSAQDSLQAQYEHIVVPLAELWKEKITGNPGFDFHTETNKSELIAFGEAKYSSNINPHTKALNQISSFIESKKDEFELTDLTHFVSKKAMTNFIENGKKAYIAAFSMNSKEPTKIFKNILTSSHIDKLLEYDELYLIGIEIDNA